MNIHVLHGHRKVEMLGNANGNVYHQSSLHPSRLIHTFLNYVSGLAKSLRGLAENTNQSRFDDSTNHFDIMLAFALMIVCIIKWHNTQPYRKFTTNYVNKWTRGYVVMTTYFI